VAFIFFLLAEEIGVPGENHRPAASHWRTLSWYSMIFVLVTTSSRHGEVYSIQHYVIKFVSDLRQVGGFLRVLKFAPPIKLKVRYIIWKISYCTMIKFVSDLRQVGGFLRVLRVLPPIKKIWTPQYNWNIVESGVKHHSPTNHTVPMICYIFRQL
jgi:hypothetical protein